MPDVIDCHCTKTEQNESCPIGYPSLLCDDCDGRGVIHVKRCFYSERHNGKGPRVREVRPVPPEMAGWPLAKLQDYLGQDGARYAPHVEDAK